MEIFEKSVSFAKSLNKIGECAFELIDSKIKSIVQKEGYEITGFFKGLENDFFTVIIDGEKRDIFVKVYTHRYGTNVSAYFQASLTLNEKINKKGHLLILRPLKYEGKFPLSMFVENIEISTGSDMHILKLPHVEMKKKEGWNASAFSAASGIKRPYLSGFCLSMSHGL
jgi:hypothetical protein